jgi:secondary thiamine-phosphate synthase enzyme
MIHTEIMEVETRGEVDILDLTQDVESVVSNSKIREGICHVFVQGSTAAITTVEYEPGLLKDIPAALERLFPKGINYEHHRTWHDGNGHSHVRASFLKQSITVPVVGGKLALGTWQQIVLVELDIRPRRRKVYVQVMGE